MFLVCYCSCICAIYWTQLLSREWRCSWSSADRRCSNYIWVIDNFMAYQGASYIRDLTVGQLGICMHAIGFWHQIKQLILYHSIQLLSANMTGKHLFLMLCILGSVYYIFTIGHMISSTRNSPLDSRSQHMRAVSQWNQKRVDSKQFSSSQDHIARTMAASHVNYHDNEPRDAPRCTIPTMEPFHESIRHLYTKLPPVRCPGKPPLTYVRKRTVFVNQTAVKQDYSNDLSFCLCQYITRRQGSDNYYNISQGIHFLSSISARNEFVKIECFDSKQNTIYTNYHAIAFPKRPKSISYNAKITSDREGRFSLLLLAIDSVSRMNHIRHFPKTRSLLEEIEAVEFTGYNKVADNTFVNIVPLLTGKTSEALGYPNTEDFTEKAMDPMPLIWKNFSRSGYLTAFIEDAPYIATFNYMKNGFTHQPTDYCMRPLALAIERDRGAPYNTLNETFYCVNSTFEPKLYLDYTGDLIRELRKQLYFTFLFLTRLSHDYLNNAGLLDEVYHGFLKTIYKAGYLNNTILVLFSDHGMRFGEIVETSQGYLEERLPFMFIVPPPGFKHKYPLAYKNLYNNRDKLTTPFDIHATLEMVLEQKYPNESKSHGGRTEKGICLFSPISSRRTCVDADIPAHYCACQSWTQLISNSTDVRSIVKGVVTKLNEKITRYSKKCAGLSLHAINAAKLSNNIKVFEKQIHKLYRFQLQTEPGLGLFDVSVWVKKNYTNGDTHGLILPDDAISRINRYGNQSWCVHGATLKKLCYCTDQYDQMHDQD